MLTFKEFVQDKETLIDEGTRTRRNRVKIANRRLIKNQESYRKELERENDPLKKIDIHSKQMERFATDLVTLLAELSKD